MVESNRRMKVQRMSNNNYYQELNVAPDATEQQIKSSYRKLAFEFHPDRNEDNPQAADRMKALNEAYAVLSDPDKRRQYDMLYQKYGDGAREHFRQTFSDRDIFQGSDVQQIFEEMARAFGLRGFEDIFKDFYGPGFQSFDFKQHGMFGKGFIFTTGSGGRVNPPKGQGILGRAAQKMLGKLIGIHLPRRGYDLHDVIDLNPEFAAQGGPYAYYHKTRDKKLVVQIPKGVHDGQLVRLNGMGKDGTHGAEPGDLLLKVRIRKSLMDRIKDMVGLYR